MVYFLNNEDLEKRLSYKDGLAALEGAYREFDAKEATIRPKSNVYIFNSRESTRYNYVSMEGGIQKAGIYAIRMRSDLYDLAVWTTGTKIEKRASVPGQFCGLIVFFNSQTGEPLAITNDGFIMHMMVGGLAGIAAKYMARENSSTLGLIGSQWMAKAHAEAMCEVRPISTIRVYSPTEEHRLAFVQEMSKKLNVEIIATSNAEEAVRGSDIVALCTNSLQPVIHGGWLDPGTHFSCVQTLEIGCVYPDQPGGEDILDCFEYTVSNIQRRNWDETFFVAGKPSVAGAGRGEGLGWLKMVRPDTPQLTDVLAGRAPGRTDDMQRTFFANNDGNGLCFAALGAVVLNRIGKEGDNGLRQVPLDWFMQSIPS